MPPLTLFFCVMTALALALCFTIAVFSYVDDSRSGAVAVTLTSCAVILTLGLAGLTAWSWWVA